MSRIETLESKVRDLYEAKNPERADWADWLYDQHVFIVADTADRLAERFGANKEYARAASLLHDIADTKMSRFDEKHEETSLAISRQLLQECGYVSDEVSLIVDDAIRYHSCYDGITPSSLEGKVLATADALAHLTTNFYELATEALQREVSLNQTKDWALKKVERDFHNKILFDEIKEEVRSDYERLKAHYSL